VTWSSAIVCTLVFIIALLALRMAGVIRPPRPMFSRGFMQGDMELLPHWHDVWPLSDGGLELHADPDLNILVVLKHPLTKGPGYGYVLSKPDSIGITQSMFSFGDRQIEVKASQTNQIVVADYRGAQATGPIESGEANRIYKRAYEWRSKSLSHPRSLSQLLIDELSTDDAVIRMLQQMED